MHAQTAVGIEQQDLCAREVRRLHDLGADGVERAAQRPAVRHAGRRRREGDRPPLLLAKLGDVAEGYGGGGAPTRGHLHGAELQLPLPLGGRPAPAHDARAGAQGEHRRCTHQLADVEAEDAARGRVGPEVAPVVGEQREPVDGSVDEGGEHRGLGPVPAATPGTGISADAGRTVIALLLAHRARAGSPGSVRCRRAPA